ncbi:hypothetical protein JXD20_04165 [Candidatus Peregrinibacteria bacterium]|nr:hypothetical protein [Candidatus Peregrinibacteria bacterium]
MADRESSINTLKREFLSVGITSSDDAAENRAEHEVDELIRVMESDQRDVQTAIDNIHGQVNALAQNSNRRDSALNALDRAENRAEDFTGLDAEDHIRIEPSIAGAPPYAAPDTDFEQAHDKASTAIAEVRKILLAPDRPGAVPTGDIVEDFIPQIIRQLFRFAWVAVFIALTVSGVMFITAHDNDERLTKAKSMIYFSLIGFAFIALAFAIVKAVTDIDFFRFI